MVGPSQTEKWAAEASSKGGAASSARGSNKSKIVQSESAGSKAAPGKYERKAPGMT